MHKEIKGQFEYQTILVTGGAGFVGSNLSISMKKEYPQSRVIALDNLKRRGSELNINRLSQSGVEFRHGDIRNYEDLAFANKIDLLVECSAEPSVLAGYNGSPEYLIKTNLSGMINCLEVARKNMSDVIFLSTSRVYPYDAINNLRYIETESRYEWDETQDHQIPGWSVEGIDVDFTITGTRSMYGATKLCSEILLQEYIKMYGIRGIINRCGVITGSWQFGKVDQGVVVLWVASHMFKRDLCYIGFGGLGKQVRDFIYVDDLFTLINNQLQVLDQCSGQVFNVGGGRKHSFSLLELTDACEEIIGNRIKIKSIAENRPADIRIYLTNPCNVKEAFDWEPQIDLQTTIYRIFQWIQDHNDTLKQIL